MNVLFPNGQFSKVILYECCEDWFRQKNRIPFPHPVWVVLLRLRKTDEPPSLTDALLVWCVAEKIVHSDVSPETHICSEFLQLLLHTLECIQAQSELLDMMRASDDEKIFYDEINSVWNALNAKLAETPCAPPVSREETLTYFQNFPSNALEWRMPEEERNRYLYYLERLLSEPVEDAADPLLRAAFHSIGYGYAEGIFTLMANTVMLTGGAEAMIAEYARAEELPLRFTYIRYASDRAGLWRYLSEKDSLLRACAVNRILETQNFERQKSKTDRERCSDAAKRFPDRYAAIQFDHLNYMLGSITLSDVSDKCPEPRPPSRREGLITALVMSAFLPALCALGGFWGNHWIRTQFIRSNSVPGFGDFCDVLVAVWAGGYCLWEIIKQYRQGEALRMEQKQRGLAMREWNLPAAWSEVAKTFRSKEKYLTILFGYPRGLDIYAMRIRSDAERAFEEARESADLPPGKEEHSVVVTHIFPNGTVRKTEFGAEELDFLTDAATSSSIFYTYPKEIVFPKPGTVMVNLHLPEFVNGIQVFEERIDALADGVSLNGEFFAVALPEFLKKIQAKETSR